MFDESSGDNLPKSQFSPLSVCVSRPLSVTVCVCVCVCDRV
uniref:Uncharacterized protein n=1 Tax=Anguilla anguilla TaxID=7936 RepID=A0A0E9PBG6_ANGAN